MSRIVVSRENLWPYMDEEGEIDRMDTVSAFALSTVMLCIVVGCVALLSMAIAPLAGSGAGNRIAAGLLHQELQTGSIATLGSMAANVHPEILVSHAAATELDVLLTHFNHLPSSCAAM